LQSIYRCKTENGGCEERGVRESGLERERQGVDSAGGGRGEIRRQKQPQEEREKERERKG